MGDCERRECRGHLDYFFGFGLRGEIMRELGDSVRVSKAMRWASCGSRAALTVCFWWVQRARIQQRQQRRRRRGQDEGGSRRDWIDYGRARMGAGVIYVVVVEALRAGLWNPLGKSVAACNALVRQSSNAPATRTFRALTSVSPTAGIARTTQPPVNDHVGSVQVVAGYTYLTASPCRVPISPTDCMALRTLLPSELIGAHWLPTSDPPRQAFSGVRIQPLGRRSHQYVTCSRHVASRPRPQRLNLGSTHTSPR